MGSADGGGLAVCCLAVVMSTGTLRSLTKGLLITPVYTCFVRRCKEPTRVDRLCPTGAWLTQGQEYSVVPVFTPGARQIEGYLRRRQTHQRNEGTPRQALLGGRYQEQVAGPRAV